MHIRFGGSFACFGKEVGASNANGGDGGVKPVALGLLVRGLARDLPHSAAQQVELEPGVDAGGVDLVAAYDQLAVGTQSHPGLIGEDQNYHRILTGNNAVLLLQQGAEQQRLGLASQIDTLCLTHRHADARHV